MKWVRHTLWQWKQCAEELVAGSLGDWVKQHSKQPKNAHDVPISDMKKGNHTYKSGSHTIKSEREETQVECSHVVNNLQLAICAAVRK